MTTQPTI